MAGSILLAVELQDWDRYSVHGLTARDMAARLAKGSGKLLHVLSVYEHEDLETEGLSQEMIVRHREDMQQRTTNLMERRLEEYIDPLQKAGIDVKGQLQIGNPRQIIVETERNVEADLLIMGSHNKRGIFDIALGGTARQVSSRAPCQVVLVSPKP
ncbi:MAG: universal stress protein [Candidatus Tectomicrobia bacterium]|nr:universal stress protein [Candidatus Tectomicrobia bacterium]